MTKLLKRADLLLILTLLCLSFAPLLFLSGRSGAVYADITVDGRLYRRVPLSGRHGREEFTVRTPDGSNTMTEMAKAAAEDMADAEKCLIGKTVIASEYYNTRLNRNLITFNII